mmetsp:Transcript_21195/g.48732  ORF Transcript_21195/g.48732 Transcript_21195/m.48732 type:complete len:315 (-) Transcript_21195:364-1308(-)
MFEEDVAELKSVAACYKPHEIIAAPSPFVQVPPLVPPLRFALVEEGIFRGAYPALPSLRFLSNLRLRTLVSLLPEAPADHITNWCESNGVSCHVEIVPAFKDEVMLTHERAAEILQLLITPDAQPLYVHCLDGRTVTGTIIMCLRKLQRWSLPSTIADFSRFCRTAQAPRPPAPHVLAFVESFKPELELARLLPSSRLPLWLAMALRLPTAARQELHGDLSEARLDAPPAVPVPTAFSLERACEPSRRGENSSGWEMAAEKVQKLVAAPAVDPHSRGESLLKALALEGLTMKPGARSLRPRQKRGLAGASAVDG